MPYKYLADRLANQKWHYNYAQQLPFYRSMGLEPLEINNVRSPLQCQHCGRVTPRNCAHRFRHYPNCAHLPEVMRILGNPRMYWNRRPKGVAV